MSIVSSDPYKLLPDPYKLLLPSLSVVSAIFLASEIALVLAKRSRARSDGKDRASLQTLWAIILTSVSAGFYCRARFPEAAVPHPGTIYLIGLLLFIIGLAIRWIAIIHLGRFFTVNVAIAQDHKLITTGPYRYVRHPSYTGTLLTFLGFGFCLLNYIALAVVFLPTAAAFLWRMHVEEIALREAFGSRYTSYTESTSRLIPFIY